jgi:hypothetical protein
VILDSVAVVFLFSGALLILTLCTARRNAYCPNGGVIGKPDHEVIVEPVEEPIPKTAPVPTVEPVREPQPATV